MVQYIIAIPNSHYTARFETQLAGCGQTVEKISKTMRSFIRIIWIFRLCTENLVNDLHARLLEMFSIFHGQFALLCVLLCYL